MTENGGALVPLHLENAQKDSGLSDRARRLVEQNSKAVRLVEGTNTFEMDDNPLFVAVLVDNSTSMDKVDPKSGKSSAQRVCEAQNELLSGLSGSQHPERVYFSTQVLNSMDGNPEHVVVDPYRPLTQALRLNAENFRTVGATPLYNRTVELLSGTLYETQKAIDDWKEPRTVSVIMSDGENYNPRDDRHTSQDCAELIRSLSASPTRRHIIIGIGIDDGHTDFRQAFREMGIPEQWIAVGTPAEISRIAKLITTVASQAANSTQEQFLMLTDGGFKGLI